MEYKVAFDINCPECDVPQVHNAIIQCFPMGGFSSKIKPTYVTMATCLCVIPFTLFNIYMKAYTAKLAELRYNG